MSFDPILELTRRASQRTGCDHHPPFDRPSQSIVEASHWSQIISHCREEAAWQHERFLVRNDLFYLLNYILTVPRVGTPWHHERCKEVMTLTDGIIDLWCYSEDTQILTKDRGWLLFPNLSSEDEVATRNPTSHEFEWQKPQDIVSFDYDGDMVHLYAWGLDQLVTPEHEVLVRDIEHDFESKILAKNLLHCRTQGSERLRKYRIPISSEWKGQEVGPQKFDWLTLTGDQYCAFMGMYLAEGSVRSTRTTPAIEIAQHYESKGYEPFRRLFSEILNCEDHYQGCCGKFVFSNRALCEHLRSFGGALVKFIPDIIRNATPRQIARFLEYFAYGDGDPEGRLLYTSSRIMAGQLCELAQKAGRSGQVAVDTRHGPRAVKDGDVERTIHAEVNYRVSIRDRKEMAFNAETIPYSGKVWCCTVPNNVIYVQRNNRAQWSGNTRGAGKSAIITYGSVIQEILKNPDLCFGLFSHNRPLGKELLRKIKTTFEGHEKLKRLFPDILWENPQSEAPVWSLDHGICVKRATVTRGEATVEAWGLVDGQPTGRHYDWLIFDDIQKEKVSEYMIQQIEDAFDTAMGLGSTKPTRWNMVGVFFRGGSCYQNFIEREVGLPRIRPALMADGSSPIWTDEECRATIKLVTPGVLACEYLMDPTKKAEGEGFREEWLRFHDGVDLKSSNVYILVDPGSGGRKKNTGSPTAIIVIATRADRKFYLVDGILARMSLTQRADWTISFHRQYQPKKIYYEKYGMQSDIEYIRERVDREGYKPPQGFEVIPLSLPIDKDDRIEWLVPAFKDGRIVLPRQIPERMVNEEKIDMMKYFLDQEYRLYPVVKHKDVLDVLAWSQWRDAGITFPEGYDDNSVERKSVDWDDKAGGSGSWMSS